MPLHVPLRIDVRGAIRTLPARPYRAERPRSGGPQPRGYKAHEVPARHARDPAIMPTFPKAVFPEGVRRTRALAVPARSRCPRSSRMPALAAAARADYSAGRSCDDRAVSSVGRASRLHREGRRFEPVTAHHVRLLTLPHFSVRDSAPARVGRSRRRAPRESLHPQVTTRNAGSAAKRCQRSILRGLWTTSRQKMRGLLDLGGGVPYHAALLGGRQDQPPVRGCSSVG